MMATRADHRLYGSYRDDDKGKTAPAAIPRESLEKWGPAHVDRLESIYNGVYPDDHPSKSTAYMGPYPNGDKGKTASAAIPRGVS